MESRKTSLKKVLATILLAPPTLTVIGIAWSFGVQISAAIERSKSNENKVKELTKEVREIHWYLIKRNDVRVPPTIHNRR
jgi:hypothetical protein